LQITQEASEYKQTTTKEMSTALASAVAMNKNVQAGMLKNMVPDPGWFDGNQMKFKD